MLPWQSTESLRGNPDFTIKMCASDLMREDYLSSHTVYFTYIFAERDKNDINMSKLSSFQLKA